MAFPCRLGLGLFLAACGALLHIFGAAFPEWESNDEMKKGVFEICNRLNDTCHDLQDLTADERLIQIGAIFGIIASLLGTFGATLFVIRALLGKSPRRLFLYVSSNLCIAAALFITGTVVYWYCELFDDSNDIDVAFFLSCAGAFILLVGGCLSLTSGANLATDKVV